LVLIAPRETRISSGPADVRRVIDGGDDVTHRLAELGEAISVDVLSSSQRRQDPRRKRVEASL
jgi:hypothetical protein